MAILSKEEIKELKTLARSEEVRRDFQRLAEGKYEVFVANGKIDMDSFLVFLNEFNEFTNHAPKPFHRIIDRISRL